MPCGIDVAQSLKSLYSRLTVTASWLSVIAVGPSAIGEGSQSCLSDCETFANKMSCTAGGARRNERMLVGRLHKRLLYGRRHRTFFNVVLDMYVSRSLNEVGEQTDKWLKEYNEKSYTRLLVI